MESLVGFIVLGALVSALRGKAKLAVILFTLALAGVIWFFCFHATSPLRLLF